MSESNHTPGPWDNNSRKTVVRHTDSGTFIAEVEGRTFDEQIANAALIARAPALLAEVLQLRAQIAKLEG